MDFSFLSDPRYNMLGAFWMTVQLTFWSAIGSFIWASSWPPCGSARCR